MTREEHAEKCPDVPTVDCCGFDCCCGMLESGDGEPLRLITGEQ